ncbi:hypothetical protein [Fluviicola sp.]|uniref:hypothetical protein n=1 Tax=Fluviicola sp. TaxID=1917219 RepID=UPI003D2698E5
MKTLSNSTFQKKQEVQIIKSFNETFSASVTAQFGVVSEGGFSFHFDFANEERTIIGEIYTCSFPLKPGQLRKVKGDILKMLTFEKMKPKKLDELEKYCILTISSQDALGKDSIGEFVKDHQGQSMFPDKSWFRKTLDIFNIQVYYYVLDEDKRKELEEVRKMQQEGMNTKK